MNANHLKSLEPSHIASNRRFDQNILKKLAIVKIITNQKLILRKCCRDAEVGPPLCLHSSWRVDLELPDDQHIYIWREFREFRANSDQPCRSLRQIESFDNAHALAETTAKDGSSPAKNRACRFFVSSCGNRACAHVSHGF